MVDDDEQDANRMRDEGLEQALVVKENTIDSFQSYVVDTNTSEAAQADACSWHQAQFQTRILVLDSGWIQGVCADILSHTWPVRGGDHPRTTPMPFQRISTDSCCSPDHPRRAETAERATRGTKTPPRPPTAGTPPAPARVRRKLRRWDPLVPIWGGSPVVAPRPPAP
jgi:hypothetical protein